MTNATLRNPDAENPHVLFNEGELASGKPRRGALRGKRRVAFGLTIGAAFFCSAAPLYTNTWKNTEGVSVVKNWGDAANWSVAYEPDVTAPASAVPTKDSFTKLQNSAKLSLLPSGTHASGSTYFLAGTTGKSLELEIPAGSCLSLEGSDNDSHLGAPGYWVDGGVNNKVKIDINGGELAFGQKVLALRPNMTASASAGYNRIQIRNGGKLSITNGYMRLLGGTAGDSQGRGVYTNIVDVLSGSSIVLRGNGSIAFGGEVNYVNPHAAQAYFGAGWLNVKGGEIVARETTSPFPIYMAVNPNAGIGAYLNVTDGGKVDLGGSALYIQSQQTNIVRVASGGVLSNFHYSVQQGGSTSSRYHNIVDIDNAKVYVGDVRHITADSSRNTAARTTFRIHGSDATLDVNKWNLAAKYASDRVPPFFNDMRLKAHTDRTADFPVRPIRTRMAVWDGSNGGGVNAYVLGIWRLSPDGGVQLVHKNRFELLCRKHDGQGDYKTDSRYGGFIGEDLWQTNIVTLCETRWEKYTTYQYAYVFRALLKDDAKLTDGEALATARPRAWLQLPTFTARQLDTNRTERISVRMKLEAPEDGTLDLAKVVKDMQDNGHPTACADDSVAGYNVRLDLPLDELKAGTTDDRIVMDFVSCETYAQAAGALPLTTNALIRAATCEHVRIVHATTLFFR